jgi:hypothetical protein
VDATRWFEIAEMAVVRAVMGLLSMMRFVVGRSGRDLGRMA